MVDGSTSSSDTPAPEPPGAVTRWARPAVTILLCAVAAVVLAARLRDVYFVADSALSPSINIVGVFLILATVANALVRFRGMGDRMILVLGIGFALVALIEMGVTIDLYKNLHVAYLFGYLRTAMTQSRMLLAETMLLAILLRDRDPDAQDATLHVASGLALVGTGIYLTGCVYIISLGNQRVETDAFLPRPWELFPATLFLLATFGFQQLAQRSDSTLCHALTAGAAMNAACHLFLLESARPLDAAATIAQGLRISSYAAVLGGMLLDNSRLFAQIHTLATSDPLTGLANYRRLINVLETEIERSGRTGRQFAVLLLDLDGLKKINDGHGHLIGSRALCRLAETLRIGCRSIDTAARYGGDEFAVVLPETGEQDALRVAARIREQLAAQCERPRLSVSTGVAVYPGSGMTADRLLVTADRALYAMKSEVEHKTIPYPLVPSLRPRARASRFPDRHKSGNRFFNN